MVDEFGNTIIRFAPNQPLPEGWRVVQLDSGHYMGTDGTRETSITVNRFHARRWCWGIAQRRNLAGRHDEQRAARRHAR